MFCECLFFLGKIWKCETTLLTFVADSGTYTQIKLF